MIWFLTPLLVWLAWWGWEQNCHDSYCEHSIGFGIVGLFLTFGLVIGMSSLFAHNAPDRVQSVTTLVAASDNTGIDGSFFLGTGTVDDETVYVYMANGKHGIQSHRLAVEEYDNDVYIVEDGKKELIVYEKDVSCTVSLKCGAISRYEFHVPEGSVTRTINFDTEG